MIQELHPVVFIDGEYNLNLSTVAQYGYIDLRVASSSGVVPAMIDDTMQYPNGIDDPKSIIGKPDDVFATKRAVQAFKDSANNTAAPSALSPEGGEDA